MYAQLQVHFQQMYEHQSEEGSTKLTIFDKKSYFLSLSLCQMVHLSQVKRLLQLVLVMPATNATSERSFSTLRRLKSYLRTTMTQERLNYLMLLHVHKDGTDALDLMAILNDFVGESEHRSNIFAKCLCMLTFRRLVHMSCSVTWNSSWL